MLQKIHCVNCLCHIYNTFLPVILEPFPLCSKMKHKSISVIHHCKFFLMKLGKYCIPNLVNEAVTQSCEYDHDFDIKKCSH